MSAADIMVVCNDADKAAAEKLVIGEKGPRYTVHCLADLGALERFPGASQIVLWWNGSETAALPLEALGERLSIGKTVKYIVPKVPGVAFGAREAVDELGWTWAEFTTWAKPVAEWANGSFRGAVAAFQGLPVAQGHDTAESPESPVSASEGGSPDEPANPIKAMVMAALEAGVAKQDAELMALLQEAPAVDDFIASVEQLDASIPEPEPADLQPEVPAYERSSVFAAPQREGWGIPADLWEGTHLPTPSIAVMPPSIAPWIADTAENTAWDAGMLLMNALGAAAGCIPDFVKLQPKVEEDTYLQAARLWILISGDSGKTAKSPALDAVMSPVWGKHSDMAREAKAAEDRHEQDMRDHEHAVAAYTKKREDPTRGERPVKPPKPDAPRIVVGNATLESIVDILETQGGRGILALHDEIMSLFGGMNQYKNGQGSDRQDWLQLNNGGRYPYDRKGRKVLIDNFSASVVGGTQPSAIAANVERLKLDSDGLLQRFLPYIPAPAGDERDVAIDKPARATFYRTMSTLPDLLPNPQGPCRFDADSQEIYREALRWIADKSRTVQTPGLASHVSKWRAILPRMVLTYHALACAKQGPGPVDRIIPSETTAAVWALMRDTLWPHALHFYETVLHDSPVALQDYRWVAGVILKREWREFNISDLTASTKTVAKLALQKQRELTHAMALLGWIRPIGGMSKDRTAQTRFAVNPAVHDGRFHQWKIAHQQKAGEYRAHYLEMQQREPGED